MKYLSITRIIPALLIGVFCAAKAPVAASPVLFSGTGHYYDFVTVKLSWDSANTAAQQRTWLGLPGYLATITSAAESSFLYNQVMLPATGAADVYHDAWLGGYQLPGSPEPAGGWVWVTGESWIYSGWNVGEPNNGVGYGYPPEDALAMRGTGGWNDEPRDFTLYPNLPAPVGYLVEFEPVPEPATAALIALSAGALVVSRRRKHAWPR